MNVNLSLTPRESEVLALLVSGNSNKEAALVLDISPRTVESHRSRIMAKYDVRNIVELCRRVYEPRPSNHALKIALQKVQQLRKKAELVEAELKSLLAAELASAMLPTSPE